jgi:hypothetical protein
MMNQENKEGAQAALPTMEEVAQISRVEKNGANNMANEQQDAVSKRTLKIWDVPTELANKFISVARGSYANKSWLYLQDLMRKADKFDELVSSGRIEAIERRLAVCEEFIKKFDDAMQDMESEEGKNKKPKTFGGV